MNTPNETLESMQPGSRMPVASSGGKRSLPPEPMKRTRKAFEQMGKMRAPARPLFERFFDRLLPALPDSQNMSWGDEADWARLQQEPLRARRLLRIMSFVVLLLLGWSAFAELDEVTRGEGQVIPSSREQIITAVDPGTIKIISVREGQVVEPGQLLLEFTKDRAGAGLSATQSERRRLMARVARLQALIEHKPLVIPEEVLKEAPDVVAQEQSYYDSSISEYDTQLVIAQQQLEQRKQELNEARAIHDQAVHGLRLSREKLQMYKDPNMKDVVSRADLLTAEQDVAKFEGDRNAAAAKINRTTEAVNEAQKKIDEVDVNKRNQWGKELSEASVQLGKLDEAVKVDEDKVQQTDIRSPMRGTVKRLLVNTVGTWVQSGKELVEIVPLDDELLFKAKVKPKDIAFLRKGLPATVKITAYDFSIHGGLEGTLEGIGANTVTDEKGNMFYEIMVSTKKNNLGKDKPITPGMVAEIDVLTGKKTVLAYILKPVLKAKANAMTER
ncbi:MAG: HlyD family type I secretion periplasmic adaptor subunit [Azoarcus sp.]|jgi:adhesin transport system membrane fusion protein|nr:HlyD family type I secretion periplasmic adaptor subunit [Azoarcus sp.]